MGPLLLLLILCGSVCGQILTPEDIERAAARQKIKEQKQKADEAQIISTAPPLTPNEQAKIMADFREWEYEQSANEWKFVAESRRPKDRWFFKTSRVLTNGDVEVWLKVVFSTQSRRRVGKVRQLRGAHHSLQFTTFHCADKRMSVEAMIIYNAAGDLLVSDNFWTRTYREPINPDSVSEGIWQFFCEDRIELVPVPATRY
jgi:hypothetical protein